MFVSRPCSLSRREHGDGRVEALAGDEARGAEAHAVALHEALHARAVRGGEDQAAENAHQPCHAATIRSTSARSASVRPRSGRAHLGGDRDAAQAEHGLRARRGTEAGSSETREGPRDLPELG